MIAFRDRLKAAKVLSILQGSFPFVCLEAVKQMIY
jgi:hypothetical protein